MVGGVAASCNSNLYDTQRSILSLSTDWKLTTSATVKAGLDFVDATITTGSNAGHRIPLTPKQVVRLSYEQKIQGYTIMSSANRRSGMMQASDQSASNPEIPSRTVVDLGVRAQLSQAISGSVWVRNFFNKSYYDYATYNGLYPADGRGVFANLKVTF